MIRRQPPAVRGREHLKYASLPVREVERKAVNTGDLLLN